MECNKKEAAKAIEIAEEKMKAGDFVGGLKFVTKAQRLFPNLENILHMKTICDVHISATEKIKGLDNWYGILQVQPNADATHIKKQYRKLALILHPDKNKYAGSETAFKLVGEANKWLSDQMKRSQYDFRYRFHIKFANKYADVNSSRNSAPANNAADNIPSDISFWTLCKHCGHCYKYLKMYINAVMYCTYCQKSFVACNMGPDGVATSSSTAVKEEVQDQEIYTSRQNPSTGAESGSLAAKMDKNGSQENHQKVAGSCTEDAAERKPQTDRSDSDEIPKTDESNAQLQVKEPFTSATNTVSSPVKKDQTVKKKRKAVEESSKSSEVDGSDVAGAEEKSKKDKKRKKMKKEKLASSAINRIWSSEDEVNILKGLTEYKAERGEMESESAQELLKENEEAVNETEAVENQDTKEAQNNESGEEVLKEQTEVSNVEPLIDNRADAEQFNDNEADAEQFNVNGADAEQLNDNGAVNVQQNECSKELLVEENEVGNSQTLNENEVLKTTEEVTAEKATEVEVAGKASHDADDGTAKQLEKEKENAEAEFANLRDAFETLLAHDLGDHQKRLQIENLKKLESGTRRKLSEQWNAICAREGKLKIRKFKFSAVLAEASKES